MREVERRGWRGSRVGGHHIVSQNKSSRFYSGTNKEPLESFGWWFAMIQLIYLFIFLD